MAETPYHPHTTLADRQATSSLSPPDTDCRRSPTPAGTSGAPARPPPPALGSAACSPAAAQEAGSALGAGPRRGSGAGEGAGAGPGVLPRREAQREGTRGLAAVERGAPALVGPARQAVKLWGFQPLTEKPEQVYRPSNQLGG